MLEDLLPVRSSGRASLSLSLSLSLARSLLFVLFLLMSVRGACVRACVIRQSKKSESELS